VAYALPSVAWLYLSRDSFAIQLGQLRKTMRRSWQLGKWLCATRIAESLHGQVIYWLLALAIGTAATGNFAACISIVSVCNPVITGFFAPQAPPHVVAGPASPPPPPNG
jgi:hypothetical protein